MTTPPKPISSPTPGQVTEARKAAGLSKDQCAEIFGYKLRTWQGKEDTGEGNRKLTPGEYAYLLLLADKHPEFELRPRKPGEKK